MYASRTTQLIAGIFTLLGIVALIYLSVRLGNVGLMPAPTYTLYANFDNIGGLKTGDDVEISGVKVGHVSSISLKDYRAHVGMRIRDGIEVDNEAIAAVKTTGLIGDKYISIELGGGNTLKSDGIIRQTQSTFSIEDVVGQLIGGFGSKGSSGSGGTGNSQAQSDGAAPGITAPPGIAPSPSAPGANTAQGGK
ncbi:MAG: outer membrane lipid asymmetry maintenance protein MlaD [Candidatus Binataceae bacterium]